VRDGLDHAEALILGHLGHQPKVENDESAVGRAQHVARVRVRMKEASVEQLREVRDHSEIDQLAHIVGCGLRELLAVDPLCDVHAACGVLGKVARDLDARQHAHVLGEPDAVGTLEHVVELAVEVGGELVEERHDVDALGALRVDVAEDDAEGTREVEVERDGLEHKGALDLDGDLVASGAQRGLVNLAERSGGNGLGGDLREHSVDILAEIVADGLHRQP